MAFQLDQKRLEEAFGGSPALQSAIKAAAGMHIFAALQESPFQRALLN